jgi:hypothetical protein
MTSFLMAAMISGAVAQPDEAWRKNPDALSVQMVYNFAACAAKRTPAGAKALLEMDFRTPSYGKALHRFTRGHNMCAAGARIRFNSLIFAGSLAEQLLKASPHLAPRVMPAAGVAPIPVRSVMEGTAICVVRSAPEQVEALLATKPTTPEEAVAIEKLTPSLPRCVPSGQQSRFNRPGLRALVALAAYRLVNPPTGA